MPNDREARSRAEYAARINRVIDHVEKHLDGPLALEDLAKVACFSPFHFHWLFRAFTGESLYQFILRLRLEKAAAQLVQLPAKSITAVALDCGFGSSATFARSFRTGFGMSASQWRDGGSKNCKAIRKVGQEAAAAGGYGAPDAGASGAGHAPGSGGMQSATKFKDPQSIDVVDQQAMTVAYVRHTGPYAGNAALFGRLFGQIMKWAGPRGLVGPDLKCLTIYHDNPDITEEDKLRISVCVAVPPGTRAEGEIGVMEIPAGKYAVARFELDSSEFGEAWAYVYGKWLPESGYQPDDRPCYELCLNDPQQHPQRKHVVAICAPVRPL